MGYTYYVSVGFDEPKNQNVNDIFDKIGKIYENLLKTDSTYPKLGAKFRYFGYHPLKSDILSKVRLITDNFKDIIFTIIYGVHDMESINIWKILNGDIIQEDHLDFDDITTKKGFKISLTVDSVEAGNHTLNKIFDDINKKLSLV